MTIEVVYLDGCPNHESRVPRLRDLLAQAGSDSAVRLRRVEPCKTSSANAYRLADRSRRRLRRRARRHPTQRLRPEMPPLRHRTGTARHAAGRVNPRRAGQALMPTSIGVDDVQRVLAEGAQLVEVPEPEYAELRLPSALNIPLKPLNRDNIAQLDRSRPVIVYCHDGL
jgi:hypothetical protein